jgi:phenol hydroxylase P2 protein
MANIFIAFQLNQDSRHIVEAIVEDNPGAVVQEQPAMVKVDVPNRLVIKRATVAEKMGRDFELQEMHMHLITLTGNVDEDDDQFVLEWKS